MEESMLASDEDLEPPGALAARQTAENAQHSLSEQLMQLRIRDSCIRHVCLTTLGAPVPDAPNAYALFIPLRRDQKSWASHMRPNAVWIICSYEDRVVVLASGSNAWEFKRVELALALEKAKGVLSMC